RSVRSPRQPTGDSPSRGRGPVYKVNFLEMMRHDTTSRWLHSSWRCRCRSLSLLAIVMVKIGDQHTSQLTISPPSAARRAPAKRAVVEHSPESASPIYGALGDLVTRRPR